jgi:AraC family transcriptional regulator
VLTLAYGESRRRAGDRDRQRMTDLAERTKQWIAPRATHHLTLARIATAVGCSVFHLCRSFRSATGLTLHEYREHVRLRVALERIGDGESDLSRLALDLGYSSHSHFTAGFRRAFGTPPSAARKVLIASR